MSPEKTSKLYKDFPSLYRDRFLPDSVSRMSDGFCCGDGWFDIIYRMSDELDVAFVAEMIDDASFEYPSVFQIKEKFGTLRVHLEGKYTNKATDIISKYERLSSETCETCGSTTEVRSRGIRGYVVTWCEVCYKKQLEHKGL